MKTLLTGGKIVCEDGILARDLLLEGDKIKEIGLPGEIDIKDRECRQYELDGKLIMPGIIDAHTHYYLKSRNTVTADDFYSGSLAAACGGVTTFIDFADDEKGLSLTESARTRIEEAAGEAVIDYSLHQSVYNYDDEVADQLLEIKELGIASIKIFTTYRREGYLISRAGWKRLFRRLKELELLPIVHAEDNDLIEELEEKFKAEGKTAPEMHPWIRPATAEGIAIRDVGEVARKEGLPIYIVHISSADGLQAVQELKKNGASIYGETAPHYLLLDESYLQKDEPQRYLMTPPLRTEKDQKELWQGLQAGLIQVVATDHCAFSLEQKLSDESCLTILPGLPGSETLLPLLHHFGVNRGLFGYPELINMLAVEPAKIFGLYPEKGIIKEGTDADLVIFDPEREVRLTADKLHSRAGYSPYQEFTVRGYPIMTFLRGEAIVEEGRFTGSRGKGKFLRAESSAVFNTKHRKD